MEYTREIIGTTLLMGLMAGILTYASFQAYMENYNQKNHLQHRQPSLPRPVPGAGKNYLVLQINLLILLGLTYIKDGWNYELIGGSSTHQGLISFLVGIGCYVVMVALMHLTEKMWGFLSHLEAKNFRVMAKIIPRNRKEKRLMYLAMCVLNPVTEELVFRGILVHQLGVISGSVFLALTIGLAIHLGLHLYQGLWALYTHVPFFLCVAFLLYSPVGILGAIGFHFAGDLYPVLSMKREIAAYRKRNSQSTATPQV